MMSRKFLGSTAALALVAALSLPTASFAFRGGGGGGHWGGGGVHMGGGAGFGGARFAGAAPAARFAGAAPAARFAGAGPAGGAVWRGGTTAWNGGAGGWRGGNFYHRRFFPGAAVAAGAALGAYAAYGGPGYYGPDYYADDTYYDNGGYYDNGTEVAVVPVAPGGDASYCAQRYRSYDPASGTFLGYDGLRHPCP